MGLCCSIGLPIVCDEHITVITEFIDLFFRMVDDGVKNRFKGLVVFAAVDLHLITVS